MESQIAPPLELADLTLGNFTAKKILGMGSSGKAELVECHSNGCQYAMKTIQGVFDEEHGVQVPEAPRASRRLLGRQCGSTHRGLLFLIVCYLWSDR